MHLYSHVDSLGFLLTVESHFISRSLLLLHSINQPSKQFIHFFFHLFFPDLFSAGIGRTGVYVMIELGLIHFGAGSSTDLQSILEVLRAQRMGMVQTEVCTPSYSCCWSFEKIPVNPECTKILSRSTALQSHRDGRLIHCRGAPGLPLSLAVHPK